MERKTRVAGEDLGVKQQSEHTQPKEIPCVQQCGTHTVRGKPLHGVIVPNFNNYSSKVSQAGL